MRMKMYKSINPASLMALLLWASPTSAQDAGLTAKEKVRQAAAAKTLKVQPNVMVVFTKGLA